MNEGIEPLPDWRHLGYDARLRPGARPLHVAVENGHFELAAYLLEVGADADAADPTGYTALHAMIGARRVALGDANPPPEPSGNMTSLEFVSKLAAHGANLNARIQRARAAYPGVPRPRLEMTPFLMAAQTADVELMKTLTDLGADPLLTDEDNSTALMRAGGTTGTEEEVLAAMQLALDLGVDIDAVNHNGETAMHSAAYKNRAEIIKFLADKGAGIEVWNRGKQVRIDALSHRGGIQKAPKF